ncbi:hypothetical protein LTR94_037991, partial [Friedmanniomyces endolithicus]
FGGRGVRRHGPDRPARRHRHPGPLPRTRPGVEGRPGDRLARGGPGRGRRRVRNAEHQSQHHRPGHHGREAGAGQGPD